MSFFKSLLLAIIATVFLTYILGTSLIEPIKAISMSALVTILFIVAALAIILSVFGSIVFIVLLGIGAAIMFMVGVFWPVFLIAMIIFFMLRDNKEVAI
jgi:hypothetical protein